MLLFFETCYIINPLKLDWNPARGWPNKNSFMKFLFQSIPEGYSFIYLKLLFQEYILLFTWTSCFRSIFSCFWSMYSYLPEPPISEIYCSVYLNLLFQKYILLFIWTSCLRGIFSYLPKPTVLEIYCPVYGVCTSFYLNLLFQEYILLFIWTSCLWGILSYLPEPPVAGVYSHIYLNLCFRSIFSCFLEPPVV